MTKEKIQLWKDIGIVAAAVVSIVTLVTIENQVVWFFANDHKVLMDVSKLVLQHEAELQEHSQKIAVMEDRMTRAPKLTVSEKSN